MFSFKKLAGAGLVATFLLISIGGLVRATKSGLGCGDDWPRCSGRLLPEIQNRAMMIEFSHRFVAGIVVLLLATLAIQAFRERRPAAIKRAAVGAFGLVIFQALLGAIVVFFHLHADLVVLHLGTALSLLALLTYIALSEIERSTSDDRATSRRNAFAAGAVFVLVLVGSYVSGAGAGYVFPDWPLMDGRVIPDLAREGSALHFVHRALAAVVGVIVVRAAWLGSKNKDRSPLASRLTHAAAGLFVVEVLVGATNVFTGGNEASVTAHLALGAAIWGLLVSSSIVTRPAALAQRDPGRRSPALRGSEAV